MKKLKIALILGFSMALTLGLTACNNGPADEYTMDDLLLKGNNVIEMTDEETKTTGEGDKIDDKDAIAAFTEKAKGLTLHAYTENSEMRYVLSGEDCDFDTSEVVWGATGTYNVTVTPKKNNANGLKASVTLVIEHDFGEDGVCKYCGVSETVTEFETPVQVNYGAFHNGSQSSSTLDPEGKIKPFGSVNGATVGTYTIGKLRKGMTVSVTGTAQWNGSGSSTWYYPVLGIAMREYDPVSMQSPYSQAAYNSGASVLVRNDGWVLLNGIGNSRMLAGFEGGSTENHNYGSLPGASSSNFPEGYVSGQMPSVADWTPWYVYSTGTPRYAADYAAEQEVVFTWQFREDNVIVITNEYVSTGTNLTSYIRVPDSMGDYTFDTVLHGEYVNMKFTSFSAVETDHLADVTAELQEGARRDYIEGEPLDLDSLYVRTSFESAPGVWQATTDYTVQAYNGTETDEAKRNADAANWVELSADTPLSASWQYFRVRVIVGGTTKDCYLTRGWSNFISSISPNSAENVVGAKITYGENNYQNSVVNAEAYAALAYTRGANGELVFAPAGADPVPVADGEYTHFVALRLYPRDGETFPRVPRLPQGVEEYVYLVRASDGAHLDVLIRLNADVIEENNVVITNMQGTPVKIDLSGIRLPSVTASVTGDDDLPVNKGGEVTVTYTLSDLPFAEAQENHNFASIRIGSITRALSHRAFTWGTDDQANTFTCNDTFMVGGSTIQLSGSIASAGEGESTTLTIKYAIPALPVLSATHPGYIAVNLVYNGSTATNTFYYTAPNKNAAEAQGVVIDMYGTKVWFYADGFTVYYAMAGEAADVTDTSVDVPDFTLNINGGANTPADMISYVNLSGKLMMQDGALVYDDAFAETSSFPLTGTVVVLGTANDASDADRGWLLTGSVSALRFGVASNATEYYFEVIEDGNSHVMKVDLSSDTVTVTETVAREATAAGVKPDGCDSLGLTGSGAIVSGGKEVFYVGAHATSGHTWEAVNPDDHSPLYKCSVCDAVLNSTSVTATGNGTKVDKEYLAENLVETGMTLSFALVEPGTMFGSSLLATAAGSLHVILPGLQGNVASSKPAGIPDALWYNIVNSGGDANGNANVYPLRGADMAEGITDENAILNAAGSYVTVVLDPGWTEDDGLRFYVNGELWYNYPATMGGTGANFPYSVAQFVELFLRCAQIDGVYVNGAKDGATLITDDFILESKVLTEEEIVEGYQLAAAARNYYPSKHTYANGKCSVCNAIDPNHRHVWGNNDRCTVCNTLNPRHTHDYMTSGDGSCRCGAQCPHNIVDNACTLCGAKLSETTTQLSTEDLQFFNAAGSWDNRDRQYTISRGTSFTFTAKFASITATDGYPGWAGSVTRILVNGGTEAVFLQGNNWCTTADWTKGITVASGYSINSAESVAEYAGTDKTGFTWKTTVTWGMDNSLTVRMDIWEKDASVDGEPSKTGIQHFTVGNSVTSMQVSIGPDSATFESGSYTTTQFSYD